VFAAAQAARMAICLVGAGAGRLACRFCERCAAVGVGKDVIAVAVLLPGDGPDTRRLDPDRETRA